MQDNNFNITKKSGEIIPFNIEKLRKSFERSGANQNEIDNVVNQLAEKVYDGISTKKLFQIAYSLLKKTSTVVAGRYRLKDAIMELGPSGFPFERFVAELLNYQGYDTKVGETVLGKCVSHEVDVIAQKTNQKIMVECKFHGNTHAKSDVKVALYIHSRYLDVLETWKSENQENNLNYEGWIVTNTRFTEDAVQYGKCVGLQMISWDYPKKGSLRERVDISGLHPITALHSLSKKEKQILLDKGIVLCRALTFEKLKALNISENAIRKALSEAQKLSMLKSS